MALLEQAFVLTDRDFCRVRRLIYDYAGIKLGEQKRNMVYNRLVRRLRSLGEVAFARYLDLVQSDGSAEREAFVNALTTNLTSFFREPHHFELLAARASEPPRASSGPMRIWSSGCSTGEEAWSIAMVMRETGRAADILAMNKARIDYGPGRHGITRGTTIYFFDPSGNRLETFGGYTAYQMDPDCRAIRWTQDQMGPAVFYYSQELNESFLSVYT